jgi:hypothetical protein
MSIYIKNVVKFVHYTYMYRMYDVFLFCVHVVVDVTIFFPCFVFSQSRLVVVSYQFIITSCFDKYSFCCFSPTINKEEIKLNNSTVQYRDYKVIHQPLTASVV